MSKMSEEEIEAHENIIWGEVKRSSNKEAENGQADTCTCYQKGIIYGCGICQNCGKNLPAT